ncbi:MAG: SCP2 sterol-binding domain-containing protein [Alphaproteobacteria bacterium]|nr:MAG: SCP2 sterol-binding domain-containing protein [Alphaproteobacteria bacterium]
MSLQDLAAQITEGLGDDDSGVNKKVKLDFGDDGCILIDLTSAPHSVSTEDGESDVTLKIALEDYTKMLAGELDGQMAFMTGKLKMEGDMGAAMAFGQYMQSRA